MPDLKPATTADARAQAAAENKTKRLEMLESYHARVRILIARLPRSQNDAIPEDLKVSELTGAVKMCVEQQRIEHDPSGFGVAAAPDEPVEAPVNVAPLNPLHTIRLLKIVDDREDAKTAKKTKPLTKSKAKKRAC